MIRQAAFLRAINVGGRRLTNETLRRCFEEMGFCDVAVFRASGNVVFAAPAAEPVAQRIAEGLAAALGYDVGVYPRTAEQVRAIAAHEPFEAAGKLQVALLAEAPSAGVRAEVLAMATDADRLAFGAQELLWLPSGPTMKSPLDLDALAALVGPWTMRTKGTIEQIASRYF